MYMYNIIYIGLNTITSILQAPLDPYEASDVPITSAAVQSRLLGRRLPLRPRQRGPSHLFSGYPLLN